MSIFTIEQAEREGARLVIGLGGISGGGKTFTALQLAWGMANFNSSKVGFICTENRRGRLYANALKDKNGKVHKFMIGDLTPPHSPERYIQAIQAFVNAGVEVLVIDSVSHEWAGQGGCDDIANAPGADGRPPKTARWNVAKAEHKRFMNAMLQSPMHIIACMRAAEKVKMIKVNGKTEFEPLGVLPIQEKSFAFELTASMMLWNGGKERDVLKCPDELVSVFGAVGQQSGYVTADSGKAVRDWVDGAKQLDPEVARHRDSLQLLTEQGMAPLQAAWTALPRNIKAALGAEFLEQLKASAKAFDDQRTLAAADNDNSAGLEDLNNQVLGGGTQAAA